MRFPNNFLAFIVAGVIFLILFLLPFFGANLDLSRWLQIAALGLSIFAFAHVIPG
jgi:hypothetical protein